jgi:hypothetical protein
MYAYPLQHMADERILQLLRAFNHLLNASPATRSRNMGWYTPSLLPVHTRWACAQIEPF